MQEGQPTKATFLIGTELSRESLWSRQRIGGFLLVVLLENPLQTRPCIKAMHRQAHHQLTFCGREP